MSVIILSAVIIMIIVWLVILSVISSVHDDELNKVAQSVKNIQIPAIPAIPTTSELVNLILAEIDAQFLCPKCTSILPKDAKFCRHCGTDLHLVKRARLLGCKQDDYNQRFYLYWQCTQCGEDDLEEWSKTEFSKRGPFIALLQCRSCGHVGDALIDPNNWSKDKPWLIAVSDPGSLVLEEPKNNGNDAN